MSAVVSWNLELAVRDGRLDDFRALMHEMVESTTAEPGAQTYEWFLTDDDTSCHICERYVDSEAVVAHLETFGARFAGRFLGCVEPTRLHVYGEPSAKARAALDGFGAVYLGPFGGFSR